MNKNRILLLIFVLLGCATTWYLLTRDSGEVSTLGWDRKFKVENPDDIGKIFISKRTGETNTFTRSAEGWLVNGRHKASTNAMENLLEAISHVELKFVPPVKATTNIVNEIAARGIKVEVYDRRDKLIKAYYVGGVTPDARGTFMIMENSEQPMAVEIPMMEGQIRTRYELSGDAWRDRHVFAYPNPDDIQAVSIEYPTQRNKSFKLNRNGSQFEVAPFYSNVQALQRPVSPANVEAFLYNFKGLMAEAFENQYARKDSVRQTIPFAVVTVTGKDSGERRAVFYPTYKVDTNTGERTNNFVERYFADLSTGDWMLTQDIVFQKIFWPYEALLEPEPKPVKN